MAVHRFIDMDMAMISALFLVLLPVPVACLRFLSGSALETQPGITAIDGISPVPTEAPGLNGIPKELRKRALQTFIDPPPANWCGFVDGDYQNILSCPTNTPCVKTGIYGVCCTSLTTDLCLDNLPTVCVDSTVWAKSTILGNFTVACYDPPRPYCVTYTSGSGRTFGCVGTTSPRTQSYVPVGDYYSSLSNTYHSPLDNPAKTPTTTILSSPFSTPTNSDASSPPAKSSKTSTREVAGIGIGVGLATFAALAAIAHFFWRRRKRARASPTDGGAGPAMAQTDDVLPNNPNVASKHPSSTITTPPPFSPKPSQNAYQQQNTSTSWDYPSNSPITSSGPGGSNLQQQDVPPNHTELDAEEAGVHHPGTPWNPSELGARIHQPSPVGNHPK